jgi:hypothetical protein
MENPYRVHSSIGFGFLQLLFITSLAYPTPPPPVYHNIALIRLMGTVYFTIFKDKPFYLKLECVTILLDVLCDTLYIRYIIKDYTYIFGVLDIVSNTLFCIFVLLSIKNGETQTAKIFEKMEDVRKTCLMCCFGWNPPQSQTQHQQEQPMQFYERTTGTTGTTGTAATTGHLYKSVPTNENHRTADEAPVYTFGGRQAFKPSFYNSSWGREYVQAKVEREFERIDRCNTGIGEIGTITGADGSTQYIRFDDPEYGNTPSNDSGINHYANIFVSPYFGRDGTPITSFSGCMNIDGVGVCLFIYNLIQFIYQLMMYSSIITSCREHHIMNTNTTISQMERWLC